MAVLDESSAPVASTSAIPAISNQSNLSVGRLSATKAFRPYYSPEELSHLVMTQAGARGEGGKKEMSESRVEGYRQLACGYIERVGGRLGFPRRTIATAQTLYHRFHLSFPLRQFPYQDVSISALLVASKLEDTLKKLREIQIAAFQILNLLEGGPGTGDGDVAAQEAHRTQLIAIERLILETICFNFSLYRSPFTKDSTQAEGADLLAMPMELGVSGKDTFGWVIRIGRALSASKSYILLSHLLSIDIHRTLIPLSYPPHTVALACLYLTSFLIPGHMNSLDMRKDRSQSIAAARPLPEASPTFEGDWTAEFESAEEDVLEIAHALLNLFIHLCPTASTVLAALPSPGFSPDTPSMSPSSATPRHASNSASSRDRQLVQSGIPHALTGQIAILPRRPEDFTRIKIVLRQIEARTLESLEVMASTTTAVRKRGSDVDDGGAENREGAASEERKRLRMSRWVGSDARMGGDLEDSEAEGSSNEFLACLRLSAKPRIFISPTPASLITLDSNGDKRSTTLSAILDRCPSLRGPRAFYTPTPWLAGGHLSTIYCTLAKFDYDEVDYSRVILRVPDGGTIALDFTPPITATDPLDDRPILVTLHGLTGGSHESYVRQVLKRISTKKEAGGLGWRGCVVNFRGCAGSPVSGSEYKLYHGGYTNDLKCALAYISHVAPSASLHGIGFSLGANVLAKYLGQAGAQTALKSGSILGCPFDFYEGHIYLSSTWMSRIYSKAMAGNLRRMLGRHQAFFEGDERLDQHAIYQNPHQTLYEFDTIVTRVLGGFPSTEAYYRHASSNQYLHNVAVPLLSISAANDPIVAASTVPTSLAASNPWLIFVLTAAGGHLGWFEGFWQPRRWVGRPIVEFLQAVEEADDQSRAHAELVRSKDGSGFVVVGEEDVGFEVVGDEEVERMMQNEPKIGEGDKLIQGL